MEFRIIKSEKSVNNSPPPPQPKTIDECLNERDPVRCLYLAALDQIGDNRDIKRLSPPAMVVFLVQLLDLEVSNGGFDQYFYNSSGSFALKTVEALQLISSQRCLNLLRRALQDFSADLFVEAKDVERRTITTLNDVVDRLDKLDEEYYAHIDSFPDPVDWTEGNENLWKLCHRYMEDYRNTKISNGAT